MPGMRGRETELFQGYTGQISIDADAMLLSRRGFAAKVAGLGADDRRIPLASVTSVGFTPASRVTNGSLRLGVNGAEPPAESDAVNSPSAVVFTWQQREPFERLHGWLLTVVERNRSLGLVPQTGQSFSGASGGDEQHEYDPSEGGAPGASWDTGAAAPHDPRPRSDNQLDPTHSPSGSADADRGPERSTAAISMPNWYPDPTGRFQFRYWDGAAWTQHVARDGTPYSDPLGQPAAVEVGTQVAPVETAVVRAIAEPEGEPKKPGMFARMRDERQAKAAGRDEFETLAMQAAYGDPAAVAALPEVLAHARTLYRSGALEKKLWDTMAVAVRSVIHDDLLSLEEEQRLHRLGEILGTPVQALEQRDYPLFEELVIAGINAGRLPRLDSPGMILKPGEVAYASFAASLMKEQAVRQFRAGTSSVSVPLGGGIRYRVGGIRGRSVVVGSEIVVQDTGELFITSQRALYTGQARTLEFRNDRLVGLEQYTDGLRLNVSNRQTASLFRMKSPSIAAALISASVAHNR